MSITQFKVRSATIYIEEFPSGVISSLCNFCKSETKTLVGSIQTLRDGADRIKPLGRMCEECWDKFNKKNYKQKTAYLALWIIKRK